MFTTDWSTKLFITFYPEYEDLFRTHLLMDPDYMVRSEHFNDGTLNRFEIGFKDDEWFLPEPKHKLNI